MRVLVACEESQTITKLLRASGHEAFSCDIKDCSGGHPEWHIKGDVFTVIKGGWDMMIAHPPCTFLSVSGARWLYNKDGSRNEYRWDKRALALQFVQDLMDAPINRIAIENPISVISSQIRKPEQIIRPFMFGDDASKATCLWLKNLPKLVPTNVIEPTMHTTKTGRKYDAWWFKTCLISNLEERATARSKTFEGVAGAIVNQWGTL